MPDTTEIVGDVAAALTRALHLEHLLESTWESDSRRYWRNHLHRLAGEVVGVARHFADNPWAAELDLQQLLHREHCPTPLSTAARLVDGPLAPCFREVA